MRAFRTDVGRTGIAAALLVFAAVHGPVAAADGDPARGEDTFKAECSECHSVRKGKNKKGPSLFGIADRKAASIEGEVYSDALKATGWVWSDDRLREYLSRPVSQSNPGGKMKYEGLRDARALDDLLAFLKTVR